MNRSLLVILLFVGASHAWAVNDPMRPPFFDGSSTTKRTKAEVVKPLTLSMILTASERKIAIINNQSVQVGDNVSGYRVVRIKEDRVVVTRKGRNKEVMLGKPQQRDKTKVANRHAAVGD